MNTSGEKPFVIEHRDGKLHVGGDLQLTNGRQIWQDLHHAAETAEGELDIDLTDVEVLDGAAAALLVDLRARLAERGVKSEFVGATNHSAALVGLYRGYEPPLRRRRLRRHGFFDHFAGDARALAHAFRTMVEFVGDTIIGAIAALVSPIWGKRRSLFQLVVHAGTDAIPLVLLLDFLLGFVMAYDTSEQLQRYGAGIYIADVVGVAVTREISPVITSIIVLGRSAAAYAAELGTMKVSEELDALHTMGFIPVRHLVLPRLLALAIVTPLLTLLGDVSGVLGGALVATTKLDVSASAYVTEIRHVVVIGDVVGGMVKASVAGLTIAMIGAQQGFATRGGPAGVGLRTTSTVVKSLVALVLIDAFFAVVLGALRK